MPAKSRIASEPRPTSGKSASRRSWQEKLEDDKDLPKSIDLEPAAARRWGGRTMVIARPRDVDEVIRGIRKGETATINDLRKRLAARYHTETACPITTGIFAWISANAAFEREQAGAKRVTPWWRVLKEGHKLNPKFPGGIEEQARRLTAEGHRVAKGRLVVDAGWVGI